MSVILPAYNREALLPRALDSVIAQTFEDWEIVLVDDGSTDGTPAAVRRYANRLEDRLLVLRQQPAGSSSARTLTWKRTAEAYLDFWRQRLSDARVPGSAWERLQSAT